MLLLVSHCSRELLTLMIYTQAISELDPGAITGPLSAIFRACISELATHFDYDIHNLQAMPVWRISCVSLSLLMLLSLSLSL